MKHRWTGCKASAALLSLLVFSSPSWALGRAPGPPAAPGPQWAPTVEEAVAAGLERRRAEATVARLAGAGFAPEQGRSVLEPAFAAARAGLPGDRVLSKIDEGVLKGAGPEELGSAARARGARLRDARELLTRHGYTDPAARSGELLAAAALALESGLPPQRLEPVLTRGRDRSPARIQTIVEAGEALYLAGLDADTVGALMVDCLDRELRRPEILRVVRFATDQMAHGVGGPALRQRLWGHGAEGHPAGSGAGGPMGGTDAGPGYGPGGSGAQGGSGGGRMGGTHPPRGGHR